MLEGGQGCIYMGAWIEDAQAGAVDADILPWGREAQSGSHPVGMYGIPGAVLTKPWDMMSRWFWESQHKLRTTRDKMLAPKGPQRGLREAEGPKATEACILRG